MIQLLCKPSTAIVGVQFRLVASTTFSSFTHRLRQNHRSSLAAAIKMSSALIWQLTRKSTSRSSKRTQPKVAVTCEKGSLSNIRKSADSGLTTTHAVDVDVDDNGVPVLSLKNTAPEDARKPDKMWKTTRLNGGVRKALQKTDRALEGYRPAAKKQAMRKVSALYKAEARKNRGVDHTTLKAGRTVAASE